MININFLTVKNNNLCGFEIKGHANFASYNKDIVCSAVSSVLYMTLNTITEILKVNPIIKIKNDGYMYLKIYNENIICCKNILEGLKLHLLSLEKDYPKNIKIDFKEVT